MGFDWDSNNIEHISRHDVYPDEAEQVFNDPRRLGTSSKRMGDEKRRAIIGRTYGGRILFVVYTRRDARIRVVTARDATTSEKRLYRR